MTSDPKKILLAKLPPVNYQNTVIYDNGNNEDIQEAIKRATPKAVKQAQNIASYFDKSGLLKSGAYLHAFIRQNLSYRKDPTGYQQIKLPNRYLVESGDCKSKSLFCFAILTNLGYKCRYKLTNYDISKGLVPSHIYVEAKDNKGNVIYIDGTYKHFNKELKPNYYQYMTIQELSDDLSEEIEGLKLTNVQRRRLMRLKPQSRKNVIRKARIKQQQPISGPKLKKLVSKAKGAVKVGTTVAKVAKKVVATGVKVGAAAPRAAFLGLVALNFRGFATNLNASKGDKLKKAWSQIGGDYNALLKAISSGAKKKALLKEDLDGISEPVTVAATVASATPIIVKLTQFLGKVSQSGAGKAVTKVLQSKSVQAVKKTLQQNPELKKKLAAAGKAKAAQIVEKAVSNATGSTGAGSAAAAAVVPSFVPATPASQQNAGLPNFETTESAAQQEQAAIMPESSSLVLPLAIGAAVVGFALMTKK